MRAPGDRGRGGGGRARCLPGRAQLGILATDDRALDARAVRAHLSALGLADYKLPDRVETRAALPKTPIGKLDKRALRAEALGLLAPTPAASNGDPRDPHAPQPTQDSSA